VKTRIAAVSLVSAALVAGGAAAATAAPAAPKPTISISASKTHVKPGDSVTFTGHTAGIKNGTKVTLQLKDGARWVSLPATTKVKKDAYQLTDKFDKKGAEVLRVKDGKATSKPVTVTVR
jgi:plastocyanin